MPPLHPHIPPAPEPKRRTFDPYNSSATGHQRADNRLAGSTSWRQSRTFKLGHQFRAGENGGERIFDTVGAGNPLFGKDGRKENGNWEVGAPGLREEGWRDVGVMIVEGAKEERERRQREKREREGEFPETKQPSTTVREDVITSPSEKAQKGIFTGLTIYINGSTAPTISDYKLKRLLCEQGANISIALGRRTVTHVILGRPNSAQGGGGAGGGLSGSKIHKEITRVGGKGVKFVGVDWVLESIKTGKRQPEARFEALSIAPKGVKSVYGFFKKESTPTLCTEDTRSTKQGKGKGAR